ncbi:B-type cyclin [Cladophialophora chaetospira]|uniref:B-type cyclin n=1 Tax=Cladophialophora chaetospira TaxID=386627 RepID=A0AA38XHB6_9EURO|nr:B-type cyclin [Cladophialophora chaetospira]
MDVKPQRPLRPIRVRNDENMPPEGLPTKTIHQRNKSSPALVSSFAESQGLKAAAKRTAFGDVSNVAAARPSKDDSSLHTKGGLKPSQSLDQRRSIALLRPAQKGLKNILAGASAAATSKISAHPSTTDTGLSLQPLKKTLTKRHTTIFKDNRLGVVQETELPGPQTVSTSVLELDQVLNAEPPPPAAAQTCVLPPPAPLPVLAEPSKDVRSLHSDTSLPGIEEVSLGPSLSSDNGSEVPVKDANATVSEHVPPQTSQHLCDNLLPPQISTDTYTTAVRKEAQPMAVATLINPVENIPPLSSHHSYVQRKVEQEEYWDEEDDDNYEEEGYVTARSFRSRGDNTTGAATAVLFPQMNQRARKEIAAAKQLVEATRSPEEVEDESYDTSMVAEYGEEIFDYMKQLEVKMLPNAHYMDNQHEIQWSMRSVLMDWLVQVHHRFNLLPETLFLTVNYIDRFLSCKVVSLGKLQLVGATAIFIAAKYEEINCPSVQEIVYMVDGGYSMDEILKAERFMLTMLQFELGWPGPMSFLRRISKADDYDLETRTLAKYFLEVTLMDERFIGSPPSFAAAASHCLARSMLRKGTWTPHHVYYSGYTYAQLKPLVSLLLECCEDPRKHHNAVFDKYCDKRYKRASAFVETEVQRGFQLPDPAAPVSLLQSSMASFYDSVPYLRM